MPDEDAQNFISIHGRDRSVARLGQDHRILEVAMRLARLSESCGSSVLIFPDPKHLRVEDPGRIQGNVVFTYLDAFDQDLDGLAELKAQYQRGGLGDSKIEARLEAILQELIAPIRERRAKLSEDRGYILDVIKEGTERSRERTEATRRDVVSA